MRSPALTFEPLAPSSRRRWFTQTGVIGLGLLSSSCGWILYPERKGRTDGVVDLRVLLIDLLWLLPGVVPGVVCLAVDFATGCIYQDGRRAELSEDGALAEGERAPTIQVWLDGVVVAEGSPGANPSDAQGLRWSANVDREAAKARGLLVVTRHRRTARAEAPLRDLI
ncbi:MAG: hypothetical protein IPG45_08925 [Deltaproteobacteria bacterium]|nr:hypothetical protein [Deltaproteobacteria bacterium]